VISLFLSQGKTRPSGTELVRITFSSCVNKEADNVDFELTEDQQTIRNAVLKHCARFPDDYWLERDHDGVFPRDFHQSMAEAGWLGLAMRS
jgi:alkylation response protein AidB-like acyl-CoA dehydrogenase